jgi:hypothetical protein
MSMIIVGGRVRAVDDLLWHGTVRAVDDGLLIVIRPDHSGCAGRESAFVLLCQCGCDCTADAMSDSPLCGRCWYLHQGGEL